MPNGISIAIASGDYHNPAIWMDGVVPSDTDDVYSNGCTIGITQSLVAKSFKNTAQTDFILPSMCVPLMTSNTTPSGIASSQHDTSNSYKAFDRNNATYLSPGNKVTWIKYQFPVAKCIRRYYVNCHSSYYIKSWTFEGSNDNSVWATLHTVTGTTLSAYDSGVFSNANSYLYYRLNITDASSTTQCIYTFEMTESANSVTVNNSGGAFSSSMNGISVNAECFAGPNTCMTWNHTGTSYHIGNGNASQSAHSAHGISNAGTGTLVHTGNGVNVGVYWSSGVNNASSGIIVSNGNYTAGIGTNNASCGGSNSGSGVFSIIGSSTGSKTSSFLSACGVYAYSGTLIFNGTSYGNKSAGLYGASGSTIIFTGISTIAPGGSFPGIYTLGLLRFSGQLINVGAFMAIMSVCFELVANTETSWIMQDSDGVQRLLSTNATDLSQPAESDVRENSAYGAIGQFTGTLKVPDPGNVRKGVPTDDTVGTAELTAADLLNEIATSNNEIAIRLRNAATVQSTGDQLAELQ